MTTHLRTSEAPGVAVPLCGVKLRRLDWDTDFFGPTMGALTLLSGSEDLASEPRAAALARDLDKCLIRARAEGYAHLIFRVSGEDLPTAWAAERAGLRLVDVGIDSTFNVGRTRLPDPPAGVPMRLVRDSDLPALRELAAHAFVFSRFAVDPFFTSEQVADFHRQWITNLCAGLAQAVLVCEVDGEVAGFVSCAMSGEEGRIPLIATHGGYRRLGLGRALVSAALRWFAGAGARVIHVKTQAHNYPALGLYHRAGFNVSKTELTFSIVL
jgi:ribosomal protein S18 acetylase RimI-like enzyme